MTELQKYYAHAEHLSTERPVDIEWGSHEHVYLASEADAHIAALTHSNEDQANTILNLREELSCALQSALDQRRQIVAALKQQHAEDLSRINGAIRKTDEKMQLVAAENERLRKQAERYEKLRRLYPKQYQDLWMSHLQSSMQFDEMVDALP